MKKLTIIILTIGTILLSGCGANQNQVNSENKNLSQEKVAVNSGEKVKNSMKDKDLVDNTKQEKQAVKTDKKQDNEVGTVKTLVANTEENKPKQNEATKQNETDNTGVEVDYKIQELTDYNNCLINKEDFENMQKAVRKLFTGDNNDNIILSLKYKTLCLPKYKLIGMIKRGDPDKITVESCHDGKPYTLKNFKKGDKKFEYNIAYDYGNVCIEDNISYEFSFYKDGEKLNELNLNKSFFQENEFNIFYQKDNKIYSLKSDNIDHPNIWKIKGDKLINAIIGGEWWDDYYSLYRGNYYKNTYISLFIKRGLPAGEQFNAYTLLDNGDIFIGAKNKDIYNNIPIFQKINISSNNIKFQNYISDDKYKKYLISGYDLCYFGPNKNKVKSYFLNQKFFTKHIADNNFIYLAGTGTIYNGYIDSGGFLKIICKNKYKYNSFGTFLPKTSAEDLSIVDIKKVSVGKSLLKKLGINLSKSEQDITYFKNLNKIIKYLLLDSLIYHLCLIKQENNKKLNCSSLFPGFKFLENKGVSILDKSKIKKVILKLKPEHYPFGEERYLYEVWINGKKISAEKYFKKNY